MTMWEQMNKLQQKHFNDSSNWVGEVLPVLTGTKQKCAHAESTSSTGNYPSIPLHRLSSVFMGWLSTLSIKFVTPINTSTIPTCNDKPKEYTVKLWFFIFWIYVFLDSTHIFFIKPAKPSTTSNFPGTHICAFHPVPQLTVPTEHKLAWCCHFKYFQLKIGEKSDFQL